MDADGGDYRVLAEATDVEFERGWSAIRLVCRLVKIRKRPRPYSQVACPFPPPSRATLHRWLARGVERQLLCCEASSRRNVPYFYWLLEAEETGD